MSCIFCTQTVKDWNEGDNSAKTALKNKNLYNFFCKLFGISDSVLNSLENVPSCDECYLHYNELQNIYQKLEDMKLSLESCTSNIRKRVNISTTQHVNEEQEQDSNSEQIPNPMQIFRKEILNAKSGLLNTASDVLHLFTTTSEKNLNDYIKDEPEEIKVEPIDLEFEDDDRDGMDYEQNEFEIHPEVYHDAHENLDNDHEAESSNKAGRKAKVSRGSAETNSSNETEPKKRRSRKESIPKNSKKGEREKSGGNKRKRESRSKKSDTGIIKIKAKRLVISSDESDGNEDENADEGSTKSDMKNKLPCPICQKFFPKPSRLRRHTLIVHEKQKPFVCPICPDLSFARKHVYMMHLIQTHDEGAKDKPLSCEICQRKFSLQILLDRHVAFHKLDSTKPMECHICGSRFKTDDKKGLEMHIQCTHFKRPNQFPCDICNTSFQNRTLLLKHDSLTHPEKFNLVCDNLMCDKRYSIPEFLETHKKTHTNGPFNCTICKWEVLSAELLSEHLMSHTGEKRIKCENCEERFSCLPALKRHRVKAHGADKPFECIHCKKRFTLNSDMSAHVREVHGGYPNQFTCEYSGCGKGFPNLKYLNIHIRKIHEFKKVVYCDICGKRLKDGSSLKDHMNSHAGVKPYQCSYCEKRFVKKNTLKCHILTHTGEKPFVCHVCTKAFTQSHCLKTHLKSHMNTNSNATTSKSSASSSTRNPSERTSEIPGPVVGPSDLSQGLIGHVNVGDSFNFYNNLAMHSYHNI